MKAIGRNMTLAGGLITAGFGMAIKTASQFEQSMANTASVAGATADELKKLSDYAREMGEQSVFSASQAADGMYYLASAGMNVDEVMSALKGTLDLAAATQSDLAFTSETVAATLSQFALDASEADRVANVFAATISMSQATMDKLSTSMSYVGPMAKSMGMSLEDTVGILGNLYNAGYDASMAGTALRMSFAQLIEPTTKGQEVLDRLTISVYDSTGKMRPFADIIDELAVKGLSTADAMALFGKRAGPAMLALVSQGEGAIRELTDAVTGTEKATEMAAMQIDTFQGAMKLLRSAFEELQITLVQDLMPAIKGLIEWVTEGIKKISDWMKENPKLTETIVKITASVGALMLVLGPLLMILPGLVTAFATVKIAIIAIGTVATGPIGLFIIAIGAAYVACGKLTEYLRETIGGMREFRGELEKFEVKRIDAEINELIDTLEQLQKRFYEIPKGIGRQYILTMMDEINKRLEMLHKRREELIEVEEEEIAVTDELAEAEKKAKEATEKLSEATIEIKDKILALTDPIKYQIKLLDEVIKAYKEEGVASELLQKYYDLEIATINKVAEAKKKLADMTKSLTDKIYEFTHTEEEVKLRDINREYDLLIENAKEVFKGQKELAEAIKIINEKRQEEIDALKESNELKKEATKDNKDLKDSYDDLGKKIKETSKVTQFLGQSYTMVAKEIDKARVSLSTFTTEAVAAAIAQIKMHYYPEMKRLTELIREAGHIRGLREWYEADLKVVMEAMMSDIETIKYGFEEYNKEVGKMPSSYERAKAAAHSAANSMVSSWGMVTNAAKEATQATASVGGGAWGAVRSYAVGTPYVPRTGLAVVHRGEEINPPGQRSYDYSKSYKSSINIQPGAINIITPKFSATDGQELFRQLERQIKMRGLRLVRV